MKKQTFSLRRSKLGTVSALVGLSIVGAVAYTDGSALAADTTPTSTNATESKTTVTKEQLQDAEKKVLDTKAAIEEKEKKRPELALIAKKANSEEKYAAEKLSEATPAAIQKAKDDAAKAAEDVKAAEDDLKAKKTDQETLTKDVATKQANADKANTAVDTATKKVQDLENGTPSLTAAEKAKADAEKAKTDAEKAKTDAEKAKANAEKADADAAKKVTTLNNELTTKKQALAEKEKSLKDLGDAPQGYDFSDVKFNLGADFAAALNERAKLMGENDPNNTGDGRANELNTRNQAEVTANAEKLKQLAKTNMAKNTYTNTTDTREVDIWNLTADQKREINLFGLHIVNQIREQLGNPKVKTTVGMEKFANEAATNRNNAKFQGTTNPNDPTENSKYKKVLKGSSFNYANYDYDGINAAARANGLSYKTDNNQNQADIMQVTKNPRDGKFIEEKSYPSLQEAANPKFTMTMGQLKEYIFEAYKQKMFTNDEDFRGSNYHRKWENALSIGGSIAFRKDGEGNKLGRKASEYNATSVTATVSVNPKQFGTEYYSNLEIFVHNFQTAGENTAPGQDTNSIVLDPAKFNATEIKNDPTAAKEYSAKKQAAEKAVKDAQTEVTTAQNNLDAAKQYKNQLPVAEKALQDATSKLTAAEKALQDAETNLDNLRKGISNKSDEINNAKTALETAKQEAEKAKTALAEAKAKLAKADEDVKKAAPSVIFKLAAKNEAEELVRSLENAKENYAKAKADKETADAKLKELDSCLADKHTELAKLEEEYKNLLKQYIGNLTQPGNPELTFTEEVKEEEIKFNVVEELDSSLKEGERVVKTKGVTGRKSVKTITFKSGNTVVDTAREETILTPAVDEVVAVGPKVPEQTQPGNPGTPGVSGNPGTLEVPGKQETPGASEEPKPKPGNPGSQKTPSTTEQPKAPVQSQVNAKLKALPNTGQSENGVASVAALAALAIAARLRKAKN
ncbi:SEC10/PgrA surface exclusion domain-containing protein [Gemella haemolysans]|uniref:SEC10/PgrA surface exclusion domain-containing protein n=1 Tax=Gemella haemolysans TaxID=1379 RepID=A0AAW6B1J7_9BACL|nr:SEC10/PgrA surface exclusion domain-containing protein [Gemella haemolysans]MDB6185305.1 SEC10/PgrA surface exclusion domain-containing protein [Gemella haemolysans]